MAIRKPISRSRPRPLYSSASPSITVEDQGAGVCRSEARSDKILEVDDLQQAAAQRKPKERAAVADIFGLRPLGVTPHRCEYIHENPLRFVRAPFRRVFRMDAVAENTKVDTLKVPGPRARQEYRDCC